MDKFKQPRCLIGNFLIIAALALAIFIYYPYLGAYVLPAKPLDDSAYYIQIPKIKASSKIIDNVDPWNKDIYGKALEEGVAKAQGFDNFYFAHSSLSPWKMTRANTPFLRLGELKAGDRIIIHKDSKDYVYIVEDKKEVWPSEVSLVFEKSKEYLILQTCTPLGTDWKRLLIFAKLT